MAQQPSQHIQNSTINVQAQSAHLNSMSIIIYHHYYYSHKTICFSNISLFSKSIKIQVDSSLGWTLVVDPLSGLHGEPRKTGKPRRSRANLLQLTGGLIWARTQLLNCYRRTGWLIFRDHIGLTAKPISYFWHHTHKEQGFLRNQKKKTLNFGVEIKKKETKIYWIYERTLPRHREMQS